MSRRIELKVLPVNLPASGPVPSVLVGGPADGHQCMLALTELDVILRAKAGPPLAYRWMGLALAPRGYEVKQVDKLEYGRFMFQWPIELRRVYFYDGECGRRILEMEQTSQGVEEFSAWVRATREESWLGGRLAGVPDLWDPSVRITTEG